MTENEVRELWVYVQGHWPLFEIPADDRLRKVKLLAWRDVLTDLDPADVRAAVVALAATGREYAPSTGQLRRSTLELTRRRDGVRRPPDVDQAWAEVVDAIRSVGWTGRPEWSHPVVEQTVRSLGWRAICQAGEPGVVRGHFFRAYAVACERESEALDLASPPPLLAGRYGYADAATTAVPPVTVPRALGSGDARGSEETSP